MRVLVCGSRDWDDRSAILRELQKLPPDTEIIHGAAVGADSIAGEIATDLGLAVRSFPAEWNRHGRAAGPIRNNRMLKENPDLVLAFTKNLLRSRGTADMVRRAESAGVETAIFEE